MYSILVAMALATMTQCPDEEIIHFEGKIQSKIYITGIFEDNSKIAVPVINGYLPRIKRIKMPDGHVQRHFFFFYEENLVHYGECVVQYAFSPSKKMQPPILPSPPNIDHERIFSAISNLEKNMLRLEKEIKEMKKESQPKNPILTPNLKRPSEF